MKVHYTLLILLSLQTFFISCNSSDSGDDPNNDVFDRKSMLTNWADNIIIPAYTDFQTRVNELDNQASIFVANPTDDNLSELRVRWLNAYMAWQAVAMFEIGPAESISFRENMNIYPTDVLNIDENIQEGRYTLTLSVQRNEQGFPALDYLLYGLGGGSDILSFYTTNEFAENYRTYLHTLTTSMKALTDEVVASWSGTYRDEFVDNDGSSGTSSVDRMVNDYILYYERALRSGKVGFPAGIFSEDPLPQNVEGLYSQLYSKQLFDASLAAVTNFFEGKHFGSNSNGQSLDDYLDILNSTKNGSQLSTLILDQFESTSEIADELSPSFESQVNHDVSLLVRTYEALNTNLIYLKVDMLQALDINVDYIDSDGD